MCFWEITLIQVHGLGSTKICFARAIFALLLALTVLATPLGVFPTLVRCLTKVPPHVNTLRIFSARTSAGFRLSIPLCIAVRTPSNIRFSKSH